MKTATEQDAWAGLFGSSAKRRPIREVDLEKIFREVREGRVDPKKLGEALGVLQDAFSILDRWLDRGNEIHGLVGDALSQLEAVAKESSGRAGTPNRLAKLGTRGSGSSYGVERGRRTRRR